MRVLVTGGAGFLGTALVRALLRRPVGVGGAAAAEVDEVLVADMVAPPADVAGDPRVVVLQGELGSVLASVPTSVLSVAGQVDLVVHLAGVVSSAAEQDLDLGMRTNVDATRALLDWARGLDRPPVVVFSSSLAVYGSDPAFPPVTVVDDHTLPRPQSSYGIQKFIGEQLMADYTRRGLIRGRTVRLMTVAVRPGRPNAAASSFLSSIIREPLAGERAVCPVPPDLPIALSSPARTIEGILRAAAASDAEWGSTSAMNLPALTTTPRAMVDALREVAGDTAADLVDWVPDPAIIAIVGSWPAEFRSPRATSLGLHPETSFADIIRAHLAATPPRP